LLSLARNLLIHQSIKTTKTKAKAVRPLIEKLISLGKENSLFARRKAYKILNDHKLVSLLFNDIAPRFNNRIGGYTRILTLGARRGDNAQIVILELTEIKKKERKLLKKEKEVKPEEEKKPQISEEKPEEAEKKPKTEVAVKEKPPITKKPPKKFLRGIRNIFKKERDSL
jgi:large subunit ribosomal protein L17